MPLRAVRPSKICWRLSAALLGAALLFGCTALPDKPARPAVFDFGPGPLNLTLATPGKQSALSLEEVQAPTALDSSAMLYRLAYANATELRPYAQARWSMPPARRELLLTTLLATCLLSLSFHLIRMSQHSRSVEPRRRPENNPKQGPPRIAGQLFCRA